MNDSAPPYSYTSAIGSHVGMVRTNNQDSAYAGHRLFLVADGMGGHAGGDVASALTSHAVAACDVLPTQEHTAELAPLSAAAQDQHDTPVDTVMRLADALLDANSLLHDTVSERPELAGLGTTFTGFMTLGNKIALAHIGDSRLYLLRAGKLKQITKDHTFVQRLVDSGRITEEEAKTHPRRSVLMRVLGDVDSSPDIDTEVLDTHPDDVWLLCSDGLCGYVEESDIKKVLLRRTSLQDAVDRLIDKALSFGAPDNVTVVLIETQLQSAAPTEPRFVGAAAATDAASSRTGQHPAAAIRLGMRPVGRKFTRRIAPVQESHFEPRADEYLKELIAETKRRNRRRRLLWALGLLGVAAVLCGGIAFGYQWTQTRFFVGTDGETVIIYRGVKQTIGPFTLHTPAVHTGIPLSALEGIERRQLERTIGADSLSDAREIVALLGSEQ